jgi:hypothetical protein
MVTQHLAASAGFELRFEPLHGTGHALSFPCDEQGHVDLNALSDRARCRYLYARALVGRSFAWPEVLPHLH